MNEIKISIKSPIGTLETLIEDFSNWSLVGRIGAKCKIFDRTFKKDLIRTSSVKGGTESRPYFTKKIFERRVCKCTKKGKSPYFGKKG